MITPREAAQVVHAYWTVHEGALVRRSLSTLAALSAGAARAWEQPAVACGCLSVTSPRPLLDAVYFVPRQTRYPASFVTEAQTQYAGAYWAELLVFSKTEIGAPWLVTEDSAFGAATGMMPELGAPRADEAGFDQPVPPGQRTRAKTVASRFAALWQQSKDTGQLPTDSGFDLTGQTGSRVAKLAAFTQDHVQVNGLLGHYSFYTERADPLVEVSEANGYDLACQPIHETVVYEPTPGHLIVQDSQRRNWGPNMAPGTYHKVIDHDTWQTCFLLPRDRRDTIEVLNQDLGGTTSRGVH